jgi:hypothetical protein
MDEHNLATIMKSHERLHKENTRDKVHCEANRKKYIKNLVKFFLFFFCKAHLNYPFIKHLSFSFFFSFLTKHNMVLENRKKRRQKNFKERRNGLNGQTSKKEKK